MYIHWQWSTLMSVWVYNTPFVFKLPWLLVKVHSKTNQEAAPPWRWVCVCLVCACLHVCLPRVVSVCWWERPIQSTILQTRRFTQGGLLQAKALHNVGRRVTSEALTMNNPPSWVYVLLWGGRRRDQTDLRGKFTDFGGNLLQNIM